MIATIIIVSVIPLKIVKKNVQKEQKVGMFIRKEINADEDTERITTRVQHAP